LKRLVVNADDFGYTEDVNEGILEAHLRGILTSTTLMANGPAFEDAVRIARSTPSLDIGCHLVLVGGDSVLAPHAPLPADPPRLCYAIAMRAIRIYDELAAQVRKIIDAGVTPTHLDTHKHTHLVPAVLDAVGAIAEEFGIAWVRRPFDLPLTAGAAPAFRRAVSRATTLVRRRFQSTLAAHGCRTTDHFAGFQITGLFRTPELAALIRSLPDGLTEFMCHPGYCRAALHNARTRLKESREHELEALTSPETRQALTDSGVQLVSFREL
jgi:predicted glycoside hydrolase/deacetylase ChbG (UPF0249 family)